MSAQRDVSHGDVRAWAVKATLGRDRNGVALVGADLVGIGGSIRITGFDFSSAPAGAVPAAPMSWEDLINGAGLFVGSVLTIPASGRWLLLADLHVVASGSDTNVILERGRFDMWQTSSKLGGGARLLHSDEWEENISMVPTTGSNTTTWNYRRTLRVGGLVRLWSEDTVEFKYANDATSKSRHYVRGASLSLLYFGCG